MSIRWSWKALLLIVVLVQAGGLFLLWRGVSVAPSPSFESLSSILWRMDKEKEKSGEGIFFFAYGNSNETVGYYLQTVTN